jgi:hypothetical protein
MQKNKFSHEISQFIIIFLIVLGMGSASCNFKEEKDKLTSGSRYKIIRPVYVMASYYNLDNRKISHETAQAYLKTERLARTVYVAFICEIPTGTVVTIIGPAPKVWHLPFLPDRYFVRLDPDYSRGLDTVLELAHGMEGTHDGLNPELFTRLE